MKLPKEYRPKYVKEQIINDPDTYYLNSSDRTSGEIYDATYQVNFESKGTETIVSFDQILFFADHFALEGKNTINDEPIDYWDTIKYAGYTFEVNHDLNFLQTTEVASYLKKHVETYFNEQQESDIIEFEFDAENPFNIFVKIHNKDTQEHEIEFSYNFQRLLNARKNTHTLTPENGLTFGPLKSQINFYRWTGDFAKPMKNIVKGYNKNTIAQGNFSQPGQLITASGNEMRGISSNTWNIKLVDDKGHLIKINTDYEITLRISHVIPGYWDSPKIPKRFRTVFSKKPKPKIIPQNVRQELKKNYNEYSIRSEIINNLGLIKEKNEKLKETVKKIHPDHLQEKLKNNMISKAIDQIIELITNTPNLGMPNAGDNQNINITGLINYIKKGEFKAVDKFLRDKGKDGIIKPTLEEIEQSENTSSDEIVNYIENSSTIDEIPDRTDQVSATNQTRAADFIMNNTLFILEDEVIKRLHLSYNELAEQKQEIEEYNRSLITDIANEGLIKYFHEEAKKKMKKIWENLFKSKTTAIKAGEFKNNSEAIVNLFTNQMSPTLKYRLATEVVNWDNLRFQHNLILHEDEAQDSAEKLKNPAEFSLPIDSPINTGTTGAWYLVIKKGEPGKYSQKKEESVNNEINDAKKARHYLQHFTQAIQLNDEFVKEMLESKMDYDDIKEEIKKKIQDEKDGDEIFDTKLFTIKGDTKNYYNLIEKISEEIEGLESTTQQYVKNIVLPYITKHGIPEDISVNEENEENLLFEIENKLVEQGKIISSDQWQQEINQEELESEELEIEQEEQEEQEEEEQQEEDLEEYID